MDSPRDSRNPSKKHGGNSLKDCISSQGPPSDISSTYTRVDSPELPAIHFRNWKMGGENEDRKSQAIQNDLFDSLKVGLDVKHGDKAQKVKKKKENNRASNPVPESSNNIVKMKESPNSNRYSLNDETRPKKVLNNEVPPPIPKKQKIDNQSRSQGHVQGQQFNNLHGQTQHGRPIVPYQVSNPMVPQIRPTPLVYAGVSNPMQQQIRPAPLQSPQKITSPPPLFYQNPLIQPMGNDLPSIEEVPQIPPEERKKMNSMLQELGQVVHPNQPNRPKLKTNPHKNKISHKDSIPKVEPEDQLVTAVYREPLTGPNTPQKSPIGTPPRVTPVHTEKITPRTTPNSFETQQLLVFDQKPLTKLPPRPDVPQRPKDLATKQSNDSKRISTGSHNSSNSSQSTLTPTSVNPVCASIDGKMMSLLPPPPDEEDEETKLLAALKRSPSDSFKESRQNRHSVPQVKRSNSSPKLRPKVFTAPKPRNNQLNYFTSDEDIESNASHQMSENSSVVLLQPIELKLARPAYVRQISTPDHHLKSLIQNNRPLSRSSDSINSIPLGQQTPKFPLASSISTSLTQLLQELANDHPSLDINLNEDLLGDNDSDIDELLGEITQNGLNEQEMRLNGAVKENKKTEKDVKRKSDKNVPDRKAPAKGEKEMQINRGVPNPYQVKRRQNYTIPPRHCRSLDYIPSDREDNVSNQSSACGSPEQKHKNAIHAYLQMNMPFFTARNELGIEGISVSSIASSSEMSKSDPALNIAEVGSSAYESEYDNYRPGMLSDEDYYVPDPISDIDLDMYDDVNVDNVTVSDQYSIDLPPLPVFPKKKITDV